MSTNGVCPSCGEPLALSSWFGACACVNANVLLRRQRLALLAESRSTARALRAERGEPAGLAAWLTANERRGAR